MPDIIENYIEYVTKTINKYKNLNILINKEDEINPEDLNRALAEYLNINLMLIAEYQRSKIDLFKISNEYDRWYDEKFIDCRNQMIKDTESKTIKNSLKEIEILLRFQWKDEYYRWQERIKEAEYKVAFLRRLVEQYKKFDQVLVTLSSNLRQEMRTISLPDRVNKLEEKKEFPKR